VSIKADALAMLHPYGDQDGVDLTLNYKIMVQKPGLLSIQYSGLFNVKDTAHPTQECFTTNIDLVNARRVELKDVVQIDDRLLGLVKSGTISAVSPAISWEYIHYSDSQMLKACSQADQLDLMQNSYAVFTYFTPNSLGISLGGSHALGDHVEIEIPYLDLAASKSDSSIWSSLLP
jgi:hypothetical protein